MIIGNGQIAKSLKTIDNDENLFFASGVSNSLETSKDAFARETSLLSSAIRVHQEKDLVLHYFSTTGVENIGENSRPYFVHKKTIEEKLLQECTEKKLKIYRLPNVVGPSANPHTLTNFIYKSLLTGQLTRLHYGAERELIDVEEVRQNVLANLESTQVIIRCDGIPCTVQDIVNAFHNVATTSSLIRQLLSKYYKIPITQE